MGVSRRSLAYESELLQNREEACSRVLNLSVLKIRIAGMDTRAWGGGLRA